MRARGGKSARELRRAYCVTTVPSIDDEYLIDLLEWDFTADSRGTKLIGEATHLRTRARWLYLAVVIDLATRMVVAWPGRRSHAYQPGHKRPGDGSHA